MTKVHTNKLTNYDLIKSAAVAIMVLDHMGAYFFPAYAPTTAQDHAHLWWRAVGRLGLPVWFYLVGHARSRDLSAPIWIGAVLLLAGNALTGMALFPLNALWSIIFIRLLLDPCARFAFSARWRTVLTLLVLTALLVPTSFLCEYGSLGLLMALMGYLWRRRAELRPALGNALFYGSVSFVIASCTVAQIVSFHFRGVQAALVALGLPATFVLLMRSPVRELPSFEQVMPRAASWASRWLGRRTLEVYVAHLLAFKLYCAASAVPGHRWLAFRLLP